MTSRAFVPLPPSTSAGSPFLARLPDTYDATAACLLVRLAVAPVRYLAVVHPTLGIGFPGGKREPYESPIACALRETFEETGLDLRTREREAVWLGERLTFGGHTVAAIWLPPLPVDPPPPELRQGPAGEPRWASPDDLRSATARHPDWGAWALREAARHERAAVGAG